MQAYESVEASRKGTEMLWFIIAILVAIVWVLSIVDIIRRHYPTATTLGYIALVVILPFIGSVIYWGVRKPAPATEAAVRVPPV